MLNHIFIVAGHYIGILIIVVLVLAIAYLTWYGVGVIHYMLTLRKKRKERDRRIIVRRMLYLRRFDANPHNRPLLPK